MKWDFLLTASEKKNVAEWQYSVEDRSITTKLLNPFWEYMTSLVPREFAPNVLTAMGFLFLAQAWWLSEEYLESSPQLIRAVILLFIFCYQTLDAMDGKHARATGNASPIGELFDHCCDNIGVMFITLTLCNIFGIEGGLARVMILGGASLVFLASHVEAKRDGAVKFGMFTGPGEALFVLYVVLMLRVNDDVWSNVTRIAVEILESEYFPGFVSDIIKIFTDISGQYLAYPTLFLCMGNTSFFASVIPRHHLLPSPDNLHLFLTVVFTQLSVAFNYYCRGSISEATIVGLALYGSILCSDTIVCKMARRSLHPWVVVMCAFAPWPVFMFMSAFFYYSILFYDLCDYMNIGLFTVKNQIVYVEGVFDLCHPGHMALITNALKMGDRLIVGVMGDDDAKKWKRQPYMTQDERVAEVKYVNGVHKVICPSPPDGLTEEFLKEHNISIVAHSPEYDDPNDKFYKVPREKGMTRIIPRTDGISTSELIKRIVDRNKN